MCWGWCLLSHNKNTTLGKLCWNLSYSAGIYVIYWVSSTTATGREGMLRGDITTVGGADCINDIEVLNKCNSVLGRRGTRATNLSQRHRYDCPCNSGLKEWMQVSWCSWATNINRIPWDPCNRNSRWSLWLLTWTLDTADELHILTYVSHLRRLFC